MSASSSIPREQILKNVEDEVRKVQAKQPPTVWPSPDLSADYEARLDKTIVELRARVDEERAALEQLKAQYNTQSSSLTAGPSPNEAEHLQQVRALTQAYTNLSKETPYLPPYDSLLPSILAQHKTTLQIADMKAHIPTVHASLSTARKHLAEELADHADNRALNTALRARISRLTSQQQDKPPTPEQKAKHLIEAARSESRTHEKETRRLTRGLVRFIESDLGPMLAAEELGGPVAGSVQNVVEDDLLQGYAPSGRPKRSRREVTEDKRQKRIDEIWGPPPNDEDGFEGEERTETKAAVDEMRDLVEELLNAAAESGSALYVALKRDSAAARFLVRANVAVLHRSDAMRMRLVEFGREIDD